MQFASSSRSSSPASLGLAALGLLSLGLAAAPAQAQTPTTINFDNFTAQANGGGVQVASPYSTQGFTFTSVNGFFAIAGTSSQGDGETSLYTGNNPTTLTQTNGGAFSFNAIDLGPVSGNSAGTRFAGPVTFTGSRADGSTMTAIQTITNAQFQKFSFTGFTGLQSLTFAGSYNPNTGVGSLPLFDNVVVTSDAPVPVAPVPEASTTVSLGLLLALGGLAAVARKKKSNASA